jgi:hypothetical protein
MYARLSARTIGPPMNQDRLFRPQLGSESGESFTDNQRHILIFNSDSSLILQGCKHYFALHVIYLSLLGSYSVSTRSLKVSLMVFGGQKPTLARI